MAIDDAIVSIPSFGFFRFPDDAHTSLDLQRIDRGLQIDGDIDVTVNGPCDRCLTDVTVPMRFDVVERFDRPGTESDPFAEHNVLHGDELDVGDLVRQIVTSALPFGFVCADDCRGLCPTCGGNRNSEPCDHEVEETT